MASTRGLGFKNRNFEGFFPGKEVQKTILGPQWPRLRHNLGYKINFPRVPGSPTIWGPGTIALRKVRDRLNIRLRAEYPVI